MKIMKKLIVVLLSICVLSDMGCKKDNSNAGPASFSAKVEGVDWTANNVSGIASATDPSTAITATNISDEKMTLAFYTHNTGTITFKANDPYSFGSYATADNEYSTLNSSSPLGTIIITDFDKSQKIISGSFSFTGKNTAGNKINITEGKFENVPY
jgi:hypothetical protein